MNIPDFVRTEWRSKGAAIVKFTDLNCNECLKEWNATLDKKDKESSITEASCPHSKYVTCFMSIQNVWEYEYKNHLFKIKTPNRKHFLLQKPTAIPNFLWVPWNNFWNYYCKFFIDLDFAYRFPNLVEKRTHVWLQLVFKSYPYLKNHIQYCEEVFEIVGQQLSKVNSSEMDEIHEVDDIWYDLSVKRTYAELRLFLHIVEYPLNEGMKEFFSNNYITVEPSPLKKYCEFLNTSHSQNGITGRKKIKVAEHIFEFTPTTIESCQTSNCKDVTKISGDTYSYKNPDDPECIVKDNEMETASDVKKTNLKTNFDSSETLHSNLDLENKIEQSLESTANFVKLVTSHSDLEVKNKIENHLVNTAKFDKSKMLQSDLDIENKTGKNLECTANFDKLEMSHSDLDVENKIENHLKAADEKENAISLNLNNNKTNGNIISDNDIKTTSKKKKRSGKKKKKSKTCKSMAGELNHAQQKEDCSTNVGDLIDSSVSNDNTLVNSENSETQLKSLEDVSNTLKTEDLNENKQEFDKNEIISSANFEEFDNSDINAMLLCKDNEMETILNEEANFEIDYEKIEVSDSEKNIDVEKNIEDIEVADEKENINPIVLNNVETNVVAFSENNSEVNCTLKTKTRGGKKKRNPRSYSGVAWALNHVQQKCENTAQSEGTVESVINSGFAPVNVDSQMKLSVDESSSLNSEKETKDSQEYDENRKSFQTSYEEANLVANSKEYEKTNYEPVNPVIDMYSSYKESEEVVQTNEQVYPEVDTKNEENENIGGNFSEYYHEELDNILDIDFMQDPEINIYPSYEENDEILKNYEEIYPVDDMHNVFEGDEEILETDYGGVNLEEILETDYSGVNLEEEMYCNYEENQEENLTITPHLPKSSLEIENGKVHPWYTNFSPLWLFEWFQWFRNGFWWLFGYGLEINKMGPENTVKKIEKKCLSNFSRVFNVKKLYDPHFSSKSLHITKVKKSEDFRESYENLIKMEVNATNKESGSFIEVISYCLSEEDIDYEVEHSEETDPNISQYSENEALSEESGITSHEDDEDAQSLDNISDDIKEAKIEDKSINTLVADDWLYNSTVTFDKSGDQILVPLTSNDFKEAKIEDKSINTLVTDDWLYNSTVTFDKNGEQILVPLTSNDSKISLNENMALHEKMDKILKNYRLIRLSTEDDLHEEPPKDLPKDLVKYWLQRYRLFLKYDENIKLDNEAWFSVTPEMIAAHQAYRCSCDVVVDAFCGAGGNAIQLANTCHHVIAIDIDPKKIEIAKHNAGVYGVGDRIEFIQGDFFQLAPSLKADAVLLSPPWGGINYNKNNNYDVLTLGGSMNCKLLMDTARKITENIALYVPKSSNLYQIIELAGANGKVDIEYNYISKKRKSITAYYGYLADYSEEENLS